RGGEPLRDLVETRGVFPAHFGEFLPVRLTVVGAVARRLETCNRGHVLGLLDDRVRLQLEAKDPRHVLDEMVADSEHELGRAGGRLLFHRAHDERGGVHHCAERVDPGLVVVRSEEHTSELQSRFDLVCRLLLEKKKKITSITYCTN